MRQLSCLAGIDISRGLLFTLRRQLRLPIYSGRAVWLQILALNVVIGIFRLSAIDRFSWHEPLWCCNAPAKLSVAGEVVVFLQRVICRLRFRVSEEPKAWTDPPA
jgi:hypothetical protein